MEKPIATKFVKWEIPPLETLADTRTYRLREKLNRGEKPTREEKDFLAREIPNTYFKQAIPLHGYRFDFSDVLHGYVIKQYKSWYERYAPDRTSLRKAVYGRIDKILEM